MPWIELDYADIYYVEEGEGQPLVFLHGMSSCGEAWWQQFAMFRDRFRCIAYDSVNHGHSSNSLRDEDEPGRVDELELTKTEELIGRRILKEIRERLTFLENVGVGYLQLDRAAKTLSGGEAQRLRLAAGKTDLQIRYFRAEHVAQSAPHGDMVVDEQHPFHPCTSLAPTAGTG